MPAILLRSISIHVLLCLLGLTASAFAEPTTARLSYVVGAEIKGCPSEAQLRSGVAARLGRDPFVVNAKRSMFVAVKETSDALVATIRVVDETGAPQGDRTLDSRTRDCGELAKAIELALTIVIDPLYVPSAAVPAPAPNQQPVVSGPVEELRAEPPGPPPAFLATPKGTGPRGVTKLGLLVGAGSTPGLAPGVTMGVGAGTERISALIEGRLDWPSNHNVGDGSIRGMQLLATAALCGHTRSFVACGLASAGVVRTEGRGFVQNMRAQTPVYAVGGRLAYRHELFAQVADLEWFVDVRAPLSKTALTVDGMEAWSSAPIMGALGLMATWGTTE